MQTAAITGATLCLIILFIDFARRWGRPRIYLTARPAVTARIGLLCIFTVLIVNLID